jgi:hypothetical protein
MHGTGVAHCPSAVQVLDEVLLSAQWCAPGVHTPVPRHEVAPDGHTLQVKVAGSHTGQ